MSFVVDKIVLNGQVLVNERAIVTEFLTPTGTVLYYGVNIADENPENKIDKMDYLITPSGMIFYLKK